MAEAASSSLEYDLGISENDHALSILQKLDKMRNQKKECDLIIEIDEKELHVHRNVMMAGSDYFEAMFSHDTAEKKSGIVKMKGLGYPIMKKCVVCIYSGKIAISDEECEPLLYAATMMQLTTVCDKIVLFLQSRLSPSSFFNIKKIAVRFNLKGLNESCDEFALENLSVLVNEEEFNQLELKYIHVLITAKKYDEDSKMALILQWIKYDVQNRRNHLIELANDLDLGAISWECGKYIIENEQLCYASPEFMKLMYLGKARVFNAVVPLVTHSAKPNSIVVFDKTSKALQAYSTVTLSWKKMHSLHEDLLKNTMYTAIVVKQWLYVLMQDKKFYRINILDEESGWIRMKDMLEAHGRYLRAASHNDAIFVAGDKSIEKFDTLTDKWAIFSHGSQWFDGCEIAVCCGSIYTLGTISAVEDVHVFSLTETSWNSAPPMHITRQTPAAVTHGDKIYVAGGNGLTDVEIYDTQLQVWTELPSMQHVHDQFGLFYIDSELFAVGHTKDPQFIEKYDFKMKRWTVVEVMNGMKIVSQASVAVYLPI